MLRVDREGEPLVPRRHSRGRDEGVERGRRGTRTLPIGAQRSRSGSALPESPGQEAQYKLLVDELQRDFLRNPVPNFEQLDGGAIVMLVMAVWLV